MNAYTISSSPRAMSVARGAIGSWSRSPDSSGAACWSRGGGPELTDGQAQDANDCPTRFRPGSTPLSALPPQVTGTRTGFSPLGAGAGRGTCPRPGDLRLRVSRKPSAAAAPQQVTESSEEREGTDDAESH